MRLWDAVVQANGAGDFALAFGFLAGVPLVLATGKQLAVRLLSARRWPAAWNGVPAAVARATNLWLLLPITAYSVALALELPRSLERVAELAAVLALLVQTAIWGNTLLALWLDLRFQDARARDPEGATTLRLLGFAARGVLWVLIALIALDRLGFNVTALIAGLGVGGVALALAVQSILGDLFACAAIALDKPFVVGDFIVVDSLRGTVENVGLKTTRVRSLDGELLVFSNADLLKSRLRNFKRMSERRIQFGIGVVYATPADKLRRIPAWLREAVEAQPNARFDRAHFKEYGDSALGFEVVYYVLTPDYNAYMDLQQSLNLAIYERFAAEEVEFAFPSHTVFLRRQAPSAGAKAAATPRADARGAASPVVERGARARPAR